VALLVITMDVKYLPRGHFRPDPECRAFWQDRYLNEDGLGPLAQYQYRVRSSVLL